MHVSSRAREAETRFRRRVCWDWRVERVDEEEDKVVGGKEEEEEDEEG